jgi:hypothetical protein
VLLAGVIKNALTPVSGLLILQRREQ